MRYVEGSTGNEPAESLQVLDVHTRLNILWLFIVGRGRRASMVIQDFQYAGHSIAPVSI